MTLQEPHASSADSGDAVPASIAHTPVEILAPAGNEEMLQAAVENGADAVYFGLQTFNARIRAANFDVVQLPHLMGRLHERGVKGYVTLNTLIFSTELEEAAGLLQRCVEAGVDAALVQDLGFAALANALAPQLTLHASTQMTITCAESIAALEALGLRIDRIIAARELSRRELRKLCRETNKEIEVFIHGALCVAYSGQCLTSEALGGRSANRGECAQACRLPYDLIVDARKHGLGDVRYLLSPKDLAAWADIPELLGMGIHSLKIEGRLKTPQYVAATVQTYRDAVQQALANARVQLNTADQRKLAMTFSRGFTGGYLHDINHQEVVEGRYPKKRGIFLGRVISVSPDGVTVRVEGPLKPGDGVVFDSGHPDEEEEGGRVYEMWRGHANPGRSGREKPDQANSPMKYKSPTGKEARIKSFDPLTDGPPCLDLTLTFGEGRLNLRRIHVGDRVWKTSDPRLDAELASSFEGEKIRQRRPVRVVVRGAPAIPLVLEMEDSAGLRVTVEDTAPAEQARNRPLTREFLTEQLSRLGNTPFELTSLEIHLDGDVMVPVSRLNDLRRRAADSLLAQRRALGRSRQVDPTAWHALRPQATADAPPPATSSRLSVLCRTLPQVDAAVAHGQIDTIYTDFEDIRLHREARQLIPRTPDAPRFAPATLRVIKPGEAPFVRKLIEAEPDAILVRNLASWQILQQEAPSIPLVGDYALNVANDITAALLFRHGLRPLTPSYDLNIDQLLDLLRAAPPDWYEVTVHQYMPLFHMEHCVFCRFLSNGTDASNCGRPCEKHAVGLRDRMGYEHVLKADAGCRNTVFNAIPQSASAYLDALLRAGVRRFRIDFLNEPPDAVAPLIDAYLPVIQGRANGSDLWKHLRASSKLGVTRGSLDHE